VVEKEVRVPDCCKPREANAATDGCAIETTSSPGQKGRAAKDLGSKPWGRGGWVPLCLLSAPGGVSAGALSRGLGNSNFEEPQPRRVKPEDMPSRRALRPKNSETRASAGAGATTQ